MKVKERADIIRQEVLADGIMELVLSASFADAVRPGQFVSLFTGDAARLLPRPISVAGADPGEGTIRLIYRIAGAGTKEISGMIRGDSIEVLGPLGNGFPLEAASGKRVLLASGGIGIPPMLFTGNALAVLPEDQRPSEIVHACGWRNRETFLYEELQRSGRVLAATDDGSFGVRGTVLSALEAEDPDAELILACGPRPMLKALKAYAAERDIPLYISMEERMACGVGACLGCVCETVSEDAHSCVKNARICTDGPVFSAEEVVL